MYRQAGTFNFIFPKANIKQQEAFHNVLSKKKWSHHPANGRD